MPQRTVSISEQVEVHEQKSTVPQKTTSQSKDNFRLPPRYQVKNALGQGAYGCVYEAKDIEKQRKVAIKQARHLMEDLVDAKRALREVAILTKLSHPFIVDCYDIVVPANLTKFDELYVVLEIADSDLKKLLRAPVTLSHLHVHSLLYNLLVGLQYLHSAGIWHRDLKPANCLVNEDCAVKICDFGLARAVGGEVAFLDNEEKKTLTGHVVTRWYRAPELILLQNNYTEAIDVWSVGCIFAELMGMLEGTKSENRGPLFPGAHCFPLSPHAGHKNDTKYYTKGTRDQLNHIVNLLGTPSAEDIEQLEGADARAYMKCFGTKQGAGLESVFGNIDPKGTDLLTKMLTFSPKNRLTVRQALSHEIFAKLHDPEVETLASEPVVLDFEQEKELDEKALRRLFLREVRRFHPEVPEV